MIANAYYALAFISGEFQLDGDGHHIFGLKRKDVTVHYTVSCDFLFCSLSFSHCLSCYDLSSERIRVQFIGVLTVELVYVEGLREVEGVKKRKKC